MIVINFNIFLLWIDLKFLAGSTPSTLKFFLRNVNNVPSLHPTSKIFLFFGLKLVEINLLNFFRCNTLSFDALLKCE